MKDTAASQVAGDGGGGGGAASSCVTSVRMRWPFCWCLLCDSSLHCASVFHANFCVFIHIVTAETPLKKGGTLHFGGYVLGLLCSSLYSCLLKFKIIKTKCLARWGED